MEASAQTVHVTGGRTVLGAERDENIRVAGANQAAVVVGEIDAGSGNADVVQHAAELLGRDFPANGGLDFIDQFGGFLDARAAPGAQVQPELPGIDRRKEVLPKLRDRKSTRLN